MTNITLLEVDDLHQLKTEILEGVTHIVTSAKRAPYTKEWLTAKEARELLCVSKSTLQNWRNEGVIPFSQFRGKIYFKYSDISDFLNSVNSGGQDVRR